MTRMGRISVLINDKGQMTTSWDGPIIISEWITACEMVKAKLLSKMTNTPLAMPGLDARDVNTEMKGK